MRCPSRSARGRLALARLGNRAGWRRHRPAPHRRIFLSAGRGGFLRRQRGLVPLDLAERLRPMRRFAAVRTAFAFPDMIGPLAYKLIPVLMHSLTSPLVKRFTFLGRESSRGGTSFEERRSNTGRAAMSVLFRLSVL